MGSRLVRTTVVIGLLGSMAGCRGTAPPPDDALSPSQVPAASFPPSTAESRARATEVIANVREATGGEAWHDVQSLAAEGVVQHSRNPTQCPTWFRFARPNRYQTLERHLSMSGRGPSNGTPVIFTLRNGEGWLEDVVMRAPYVTGVPPSEAEARSIVARRDVLRTALGIVPHWLADASLVTLSFSAAIEEDGRTLLALDVSDDDGPFATLYVDEGTRLPARLHYRLVDLLPSPHDAFAMLYYDDFRSVDGIRLPFRIGYGYGTIEPHGTTTLSSYTINPTFDASLFRKPSAGHLDEIVPPMPERPAR